MGAQWTRGRTSERGADRPAPVTYLPGAIAYQREVETEDVCAPLFCTMPGCTRRLEIGQCYRDEHRGEGGFALCPVSSPTAPPPEPAPAPHPRPAEIPPRRSAIIATPDGPRARSWR